MEKESADYILRLTPSPETQILYNNLIARAKAETGFDGITSLFDSLDGLVLTANYSQGAALQNIIQNKYHPTIITESPGWFVKNKGIKGSATFKMDSNFNPFDGGEYKFKANDNAFGCYLNSNVREVKGLISNLDSNSAGYELRTHPNGCISQQGNSVSQSCNAVDCTGGFSTRRTPNGDNSPYKNGKQRMILVNDSVTVTPNKTFKLFCRDIGGTYSLNSLARMAFYWFGSSNVDAQKLERIVIEEYLKPIGAALTKRVIFDGNSFFDSMTMPTKVMDLLWANGIECTSLFNSVFGIPITTMITNAPTKIDAFKEDYFDKEVFLFWELNNSMRGATADVDTVFNNLKTYFDARRAAGLNMPIVCNTCPPYASTNTVSGIYPSKRDNQSDIYDATKINGKIRSGLATLGVQACSDENYDTIMLDSLGVAGVGELNTTYFQPDGHMTTVGYNYVAQNHLFPKALTYLS